MLAVALALRVLVQVDCQAPVPDATLAAMASEVRRIWRPYADVEFTPGRIALPGDFDDSLRLVIIDRELPRLRQDAMGLGSIEFVGPARPASTIVVSAAAARVLAGRASWAGRPIDTLPTVVRDRFMAHALGRSVAHEIGHYLLRSTAHGERGLMRPVFGAEELMGDRLDRYELTRADAERLPRRQPVRADAAPAGKDHL